jgi:MGT family glycosyltransferase
MEYSQYTGGIGTNRKLDTLCDMKNEMVTMLEYSIRTSMYYVDDLLLRTKELHPDLIIRDSCALFGRIIADRLNIPVYGFTTSPTLTENEIAKNKRRYISLINNYDLSPFSDDEIDEFYSSVKQSFRLMCTKYDVRTLPTDYLINSDEKQNFCYALPFEHERKDKRYHYYKPEIFAMKEYNYKKENIAYVSSGSIVNFTVNTYNAIINALYPLFKKVIISFRYTTSNFVKMNHLPLNVEISKFVDQKEVLKHANLFITHAGYNSVLEAIYYRVPMIAIPLVNDQFLNADFLERNNIAIVVNKNKITSSIVILDALKQIKNKSQFNEIINRYRSLPDLEQMVSVIDHE